MELRSVLSDRVEECILPFADALKQKGTHEPKVALESFLASR